MNALTPYEQEQVSAISEWKSETPGVVSQVIGVALTPITWLMRKIVPDSALRGVLDAANAAGQWLADKGDILRDGQVTTLMELRTKDLQCSDELADSVHNWAIGIAVAEGTVTGAGGIFTAPLDIPAIITLAFRTIHKVGYCYGYTSESQTDKQFVLALLSASGANSMSEKTVALTTLRRLEVILLEQTWKHMADVAAAKAFSEEAFIIAIRDLAKQLGINMTKRKAAAAIPFVGAAVGASVNGWFIKEVGWAARRAYQERWLIENEKIVPLQ